MIIELASVTSTPRPLAADIDGSEIDLAADASVLGTARFDGEAFSAGTKVHVRGTVSADLDLECTRCAEPIRHHVEIPFEDVFVPASEEATDEEHELEGTDLDEQLVEGGEIDLTEVVREQLLLNLPEQVFCKEDCKGLCPQCGTNLNVKDCDCGEKDIDPRWAALKNLN